MPISKVNSPLVGQMTCLGMLWNVPHFEPDSSTAFFRRSINSISVALHFLRVISAFFFHQPSGRLNQMFLIFSF